MMWKRKSLSTHWKFCSLLLFLAAVLGPPAWAAPLKLRSEAQAPEIDQETRNAEDVEGFATPGFDEPPADKPLVKQRDYTAQERPRVAVLTFEDTNAEATKQGFGKSVSAMLVTYLKQRSQLVVVDRDRLDIVRKEQKRAADGATTENSAYAAYAQTLERLDAFVDGKVTYIPVLSPQEQASQRDRHRPALAGWIEIDAKLLSRQDGRIIAASQVSGYVSCLRELVQRLGNALEHEFLRPFYGKLQVQLPKPEYARISLTPVLSEKAWDEEKPPVELDRTIIPGDRRQSDTGKSAIEHIWVTNPSAFTIPNVLAGWYTLHVRRDGYEELSVKSEYEVGTSLAGEAEVYDKTSGIKINEPEQVPLLVRVDRLEERTVDLSGEEMTKRMGSLAFEVQRDYPRDSQFESLKGLRVRLESVDLEINPGNPDQPIELNPGSPDPSVEVDPQNPDPSNADSEPGPDACHNVTRDSVPQPPVPVVLVLTGERFTPDDFWGGVLTHEDYGGEELPVGKYMARIWAPNYEEEEFAVEIKEGAAPAIQRRQLRRKEGFVAVYSHKEHPDHHLVFTGEATGKVQNMPLSFVEMDRKKLKVDRWRVSTDVPGFDKWETWVDLRTEEKDPPWMVSETTKKESSREAGDIPITVKADIWVLGRTSTLVEDEQVLRLTGTKDDQLSELLTETSAMISNESSQRRLADLRQLLLHVDLLVLDDDDMNRLKRNDMRELAEVIKSYVARGGAVIAYVSKSGDYSEVLGPALAVDPKPRKTKRIELHPGDVPQLSISKVQMLPERRAVYHFSTAKDETSPAGWTSLAYSRTRQRNPRIVERAGFDQGGYVVVWSDSLEYVNANSPELKKKVEERALLWARYLTYQRLSSKPEHARAVRAKLGS